MSFFHRLPGVQWSVIVTGWRTSGKLNFIFILQIFSFTCSFCSLLHASSSLYSVSLFVNFLIFIFDPPNVFCLSLTSDDEMCNFYIMYWTDGGQALKKKQCFSLGPPLFTWSRYLLNNIPNEDASTLWWIIFNFAWHDSLCNPAGLVIAFYLSFWLFSAFVLAALFFCMKIYSFFPALVLFLFFNRLHFCLFQCAECFRVERTRVRPAEITMNNFSRARHQSLKTNIYENNRQVCQAVNSEKVRWLRGYIQPQDFYIFSLFTWAQ